MKYLFFSLAILCGISACLGKTPSGEPAWHQFSLCGLCLLLAIVMWREKEKDDEG